MIPAATIRVYIADDHPVVRQGLRRIVEADPAFLVAGEAEDAVDLLDAMSRIAVDVLLLDVSMPRGGFLDTLRALRAEHPTVRVLVLSVHPEDQWATRALRAGANGYLTKDHSPAQLLAAIRRVHAGGKYVSQTLAEQLASQVHDGLERPPHERLSDREFEVMRRLGNGQTGSQIAEELGLSPKSVSTYRTRVLQKMGLDSNAGLVRYAATHGLIT
jgi:two-component system invasion response regulator UvrY